ncbi:MmgE/PrpD family protein [Oceanicola sp. 22II-s10i]|uniref:MmgE/PrpD family protein n=1 Tax=Oceanicola sp. 22II-s10i TaxID=1317116 RepID=UPI000B51EF58|nr:MmgE/PrpD family protein [Oceanicola sp. 22II-s10i]
MSETTFSTVVKWATSLAWDDLPETTRMAALHTIGNSLGLGVAGTNTETVSIILKTLETHGTFADEERTLPVLGRAARLDPVSACLVHGTAMHVEDFDDTHLSTVLHPGAPIVPVALSVAVLNGRSGRDFATAVAAGVEIASRVGLSLGSSHFDRGWHLTSTAGRIGGALAGGLLAGLSQDDLARVVAMALKTLAGHTEQLGSMAKPLHPGKAAADMLRLVQMAGDGMLSDVDPRAADDGVGAEFAGTLSWATVADGLGSGWELDANAFKPYACGIVSHPIIDVGRQLRHDGLTVDDLASVTIRVNHTVPAVMGVKEPKDGTQSKFSAYHCFAAGLLEGDGGLAEFSTELANRPDSIAARRKVTLVVDDAMLKQSCRAAIVLSDGTEREIVIENATGSIANPMTTADLERKFLALTRPYLAEPEAAWRRILTLPETDGLQPVVSLVSGSHALLSSREPAPTY